jgi:hypothetical protein
LAIYEIEVRFRMVRTTETARIAGTAETTARA